MITTKKQLKDVIIIEKEHLSKVDSYKKITENEAVVIQRYLKYMRKQEYYYNRVKANKFNPLNAVLFWYYTINKNQLGNNLGVSIEISSNIDSGLLIYHPGSIIIHKKAIIGKNLKLHGNNCIGNKGSKGKDEVPIIGDNCDVGYGAVIIGKIKIGNNVIIGANTVITKDIPDNSVVAGNPAKIIKQNI